MYVVGCQRRYLEAGICYSSGGLVGCVLVGRRRRYLEAVVLYGAYEVWRKAWHGVCVVGRQRKYVEDGVFAP